MQAIQRILDLSVRAAGQRYALGEIDGETMNAHRLRVDRLHVRHKYLTERRRRFGREAVIRRMLVRAREILAHGGTMAAFDTEFHREGPVEQLGIAVWRDGKITTTTYTVGEHRLDYADRPSLFGPDFIISRAQIIALAQRTYAGADLNLFHASAAEREKLCLDLTVAPYADTARVSHLGISQGGQTPSLRGVCEHYGIDFRGHHNAGNDAHHTLLAMIAMANDVKNDRLVSGREPESARKRRDLVMYPTRLPIPDAPAFEALRVELQRMADRIRERERKARKWHERQQAKLTASAS